MTRPERQKRGDLLLLVLWVVLRMAAACSGAEVSAAGDFADNTLLQRATNGISMFVQAAKEFETDQAAADRNRQNLMASLEALDTPIPPVPQGLVALATQGGEADRKAVREGLARIEDYVNRLDRAKAREAAGALLDAQVALLTGSATKLQALEAASTSLRPLLVELQRRLDAGAISPELIRLDPAGDGLPPGLTGWIQRVEEALANVTAQRAESATRKEQWIARRKTLTEVKGPAPELTGQLLIERAAARILTQALDLEETDRSELAGVEAGMLQASIQRTAQIAESERASLEVAAQRVTEQRTAFEAVERARLELEPPSKESIPPGEGHAELRAARQNLLYSGALVAFHKQRVDLIERGLAAAKALLQENRDASQVFDYALRELVRLRAQVLVAQEAGVLLADQPRPQELWSRLVDVALAEGQRRVEQTELEARLADTGALEAPKLELAREEQENARLRAVLGEEESHHDAEKEEYHPRRQPCRPGLPLVARSVPSDGAN